MKLLITQEIKVPSIIIGDEFALEIKEQIRKQTVIQWVFSMFHSYPAKFVSVELDYEMDKEGAL